MKRLILEVRWDKRDRVWLVGARGWGKVPHDTKEIAERWARHRARRWYETKGQPTQLLIYNKNGRIGRGDRSEASYGCDSRRRKG